MNTLPIITAALCAATVVTASAAPVSAETLFKKANTEQRRGNTGAAILAYERAALLAPRDPAIAANLATAREKAGISVDAIPSWQRPAYSLGFDSLAILTSVAALACGLLVVGNGFFPPPYRRTARVVSALFAATALYSASSLALRWPELDHAVVTAPGSEAHIAPAASSAVVAQIIAGEIVQPHETHGDYVRVTTSDGRGGWVGSDRIQKIIQ